MAYLLDTNVLSEVQKPRPNPALIQWLASTPSPSRYVSVLSVGEIRRGIEVALPNDPKRAARLERWLGDLESEFRSRLVDVDSAVCHMWGRIDPLGQVPAVDCLIAATALVRGWTVVTRNVRDFAPTGAATLNPFGDD